MTGLDLPNHIIERVERRWAARLANKAAAWKNQRPQDHVVVSRKGRVVPVAFKSHRPANTAVLAGVA
jgi:hypothetical protein